LLRSGDKVAYSIYIRDQVAKLLEMEPKFWRLGVVIFRRSWP